MTLTHPCLQRGTRHSALRPAALAAASLLALQLAAPAHAQDTAKTAWPSRPVTLVVGTPPGGAIDAYARALAHELGKVTGGTFIVDYKPGANGNISAEYVQKAAPDGHTLWIGTQAMVTINRSAYASLRWKPASPNSPSSAAKPRSTPPLASSPTPWSTKAP